MISALNSSSPAIAVVSCKLFLNLLLTLVVKGMYHWVQVTLFWLSVFPQEPQRANPSSMQDTYRPLSKHHHLQNAHSKGFELTTSTTSDSRPLHDRYTKKQHFIQGRVCTFNLITYGINIIYSLTTYNHRHVCWNTCSWLPPSDVDNNVWQY